MLVSLTVGKVDAGVAVLLTEDKRLIEFPSILLPPDISSGSIVDVNVTRNFTAETAAQKSFQKLQATILSAFGSSSPTAPILRCRNATQTSVVLEWDPISLATADLRSLSLYRNGSKAGVIPRPLEMNSTKISGLAVDTEYSFNLVLRTSAGMYTSSVLTVRTHKMTDLSGITVTPGIMAAQLRESLAATIEKMGAKLNEQMRIDTTHFVCTEEKGAAWEKAKEMNVPVVLPDWVKGCEREGRIVGVRGYYLNADPKLRNVGPGVGMQRGDSQQSIPQQRLGDSQQSLPIREKTQRQESQSNVARPLQTPTTQVTPPTPEKVPKSTGAEREEKDIEEPPTPPAKNGLRHSATLTNLDEKKEAPKDMEDKKHASEDMEDPKQWAKDREYETQGGANSAEVSGTASRDEESPGAPGNEMKSSLEIVSPNPVEEALAAEQTWKDKTESQERSEGGFDEVTL